MAIFTRARKYYVYVTTTLYTRQMKYLPLCVEYVYRYFSNTPALFDL